MDRRPAAADFAQGQGQFTLSCLPGPQRAAADPAAGFLQGLRGGVGRSSQPGHQSQAPRKTAPLADLVRVHALAVGSLARNSFERLNDIIEADVLPRGRGQDLLDAMEFVSMVRIRNQANDLAAGIEPDNSIEPDSLSEFERKSLRDAFLILSNAQKYLKFRYQPGRSG